MTTEVLFFRVIPEEFAPCERINQVICELAVSRLSSLDTGSNAVQEIKIGGWWH